MGFSFIFQSYLLILSICWFSLFLFLCFQIYYLFIIIIIYLLSLFF